MLINPEIRKILPTRSSDFDELERHFIALQERFYSRTVTRPNQRASLGDISIIYLLSTLVRCISLLEGLGVTLNSHSVLPSFLIVRAQYEATGAIAFFLRELKKFKSGSCTEIDLSKTIRKMTLGMKNLPDKDHPRRARVPLIDNVMNYIDEADRFIKQNLTVKKKFPLRTNYDFLSEFCHPNAYGLMIGRKINKGVIEYERAPELSEKHLTTLLTHILPSSLIFLVLFDQAWKVITEAFDVPELHK